MRFSLMTLNLHTWQEEDQRAKFDRIARFAAEQNISCLCLQEAGQDRDAPYVEDGPVRVDNAAHLIRERLAAYGQKYEFVWGFSHDSFEHYEEGSAILSQLPMLGSCGRFVSQEVEPDTVHARKVVMARLAAAPNAVIDVYSVHLSWPDAGLEHQLNSLVGFVADTPEVLEKMKPPAPKRRGAPRKRVPADEAGVTTRLVCLAGDFNDGPEGRVRTLLGSGYAEASAVAREASPQTGTFQDGSWIDYIFVRPALRPQAARVVFSGSDLPPVSDHYGVVVEFEV